MKQPKLEDIKAYVDKDFQICRPDPISLPEEYYLIDGQFVSKEQFEKRSFEYIVHCGSSITHVLPMTYNEIIERFGDAMSDQEKEMLLSLTKKQYNPNQDQEFENFKKCLYEISDQFQ